MKKNCISIALVLLAFGLLALAASPARADRCDDLAKQLKDQIDGLAVGKTAANVIYLSHPQAEELSLGCAGRSYSNQLYAKSSSRKPTPAFIDLVASGAAIVFTLPKDDMVKGRDALHQARRPDPRRRRHDALPPPRHALRPRQDRRLDRGLAQQGRVTGFGPKSERRVHHSRRHDTDRSTFNG